MDDEPEGERRQESRPGRRGDGADGRLIQLTEEFIEDTHHRLKRLERQLYARWLMTVFSLVIAGVLFGNAQSTASRAARHADRASRRAERAIAGVQQSRQIGTALSCVTLSAISRAGERVIESGSLQMETPFTRFLEQHGYPPLAVRRSQAHTAGLTYVRSISDDIDAQLHAQGLGLHAGALVRTDGTIDCRRLQKLQHLAPTATPAPPASRIGHRGGRRAPSG